MLNSTQIFVNGMINSFTGDVETLSPPVTARAAECGGGQDLFGRMVSVYQSNEFLNAELTSLRLKLDRTKAYLETPGSNPVLANEHLRQLKARRSAVLTLLRANRVQARALLAQASTVSAAS